MTIDRCHAPRLVFLFSGHMIDAPARITPRFPAAKAAIAAAAIRRQLADLDAGPADLAICGGACGGDVLFAQACLEYGLRLEVRIPFEEPRYLPESVTFAGAEWRYRFHQVRTHPRTALLVMPHELGPTPEDTDPYGRSNLWQLESALAWGAEKVRFICLWNRAGGDGPGGTRHMYDEMRKLTAKVHVLDPTRLW